MSARARPASALGKRFHILSLNDNTAWMTALGNDYAYEDVYLRQLQNYAQPGDVALCMSVSGTFLLVKAYMKWAGEATSTPSGSSAPSEAVSPRSASDVLVVPDTHYGRVEDAQMTICHMLAYAFMEKTAGVVA